MDRSKPTKDESEANRVLEYYKKYSQNPDLRKYFTGHEASIADKTVSSHQTRKNVELLQNLTPSSDVDVQNDVSNNIIESSSCNSQVIIPSPTSLDIEINQIVEIDEVEEKTNSRSSSVASNKIEWDNGADIGYSNSYKLSAKKSASFPSLLPSNMSVKCSILPTVSQEKSIVENKEELRKMYHQLTFSSDTSNSTNKEYNIYKASKEPSTESSSSSEIKDVKLNTQSSSSDNSLKKKIGDPVAYSTPHEGSDSKESNSNGSNLSKESSSKGSTKFEGYTVTPTLTLPMNKRKLNNEKLLKVAYQQSMKGLGDTKCNNSPEKNVKEKVDRSQKKVNLCLTKPISVECISLESKQSAHKVVQTSFCSEKSSKCVQTERIIPYIVTVRSPLTQKLEYVKFATPNSKNESEVSDASFVKERQPEFEDPHDNSSIKDIEKLEVSKSNNLQPRSFKSTQTEPLICMKDIKHKNIKKSESNNKSKEIGRISRRQNYNYENSSEVSSSVSSSRHTSDDKVVINETIESIECGYKMAEATGEFPTEELLLTEMISLNHSKNLNTDIKRSIDILQKLLKSRKYDEATKKHYIKKIVQKIVDSKYSDDSTNSELFRPKKNSKERQFVDKQENPVPNVRSTSQLMDNKPWYPASKSVYTMSKTKSKKHEYTKTKNERKSDLSSEKGIERIDLNEMKNQTFRQPLRKETLQIPETQVEISSVPKSDFHHTNMPICTETVDREFQQNVRKSETSSNVSKEAPILTSSSSSRLTHDKSVDKENLPSSSDGKNWRTCKTVSEKLLENRDSIDFRKGQGDYLLHVVKEERHHQLSWINNEIEHLLKLKELLEKKPKSMKPESQLKDVISSLLKMKVGDMKVQTPAPLQEIPQNGNKTNRSEGSSRGLQTQDEVPSMSSNNPANATPSYPDNHQSDIQVFMCTTKNQTSTKQKFSDQRKCACDLEMCKCSQTTTHEEKDVQCPASKQCTCQTEPKEDANVQCNCKAHTGMTCNCDDYDHDKANICKCKKSSSNSSSSTSDSESYLSCICCKKEKILKNLMNKIPLCGPCEEVNQKNFYPHNYSNPLHSCLCYNLVERNVLYQFKQTLTELERLDIYQQYCEVLKNCKCCKKCGCKCKLPKQFKNGCAYFLKLEDACPNTHCEGEYSNSDSSNYDEDRIRRNDLPEVTVKVPNCKSSCARKRGDGSDAKKYKSCPSIQNYLCTMKPDFVERAERRRKILRDASSKREENSDNRKLKFIDKINYLNQKKQNENFSSEINILKPHGYQTKAYCVFDIELNGSPKKVQPRVFKSFKEMKELTRRKYLHLDEVRSKKDIHREKRLREANRLLANTFTRRLQKSTLRGAVDIPLNVRVVSY